MRYLRALEEQLCLIEHTKAQLAFPAFDYPVQGAAGAPYHFRRALELASPYYWETAMCELAEALAPTVPEWPLTEADLVTPYGFCFFQRPMALPRAKERDHWKRHNYRTMTGFCWSSDRRGGVWLYTLYAPGGISVINVGGELGSPTTKGTIPGLALGWSYGTPITAPLDYNYATSYGTPIRPWRELSYLSACMLVLTQRITITEQHRVSVLTSSARPVSMEPIVRAVKLRRLRSEAGDAPVPGQVNWAQRWVVSAHWRQQFYPSRNEHRPVLIHPYVKGPADKPLKPPRAKVFAVIR